MLEHDGNLVAVEVRKLLDSAHHVREDVVLLLMRELNRQKYVHYGAIVLERAIGPAVVVLVDATGVARLKCLEHASILSGFHLHDNRVPQRGRGGESLHGVRLLCVELFELTTAHALAVLDPADGGHLARHARELVLGGHRHVDGAEHLFPALHAHVLRAYDVAHCTSILRREEATRVVHMKI